MRQIPPSLLEKINKQNQTIYENANPQMEVSVARAKTTVMDSTYWTTETIRTKVGLSDVSLAPRRYAVSGRPNRIYEIHVDNGVVGTAIREYPDRLKDGWQNQFTLGAGSNVALAFDGHWERYKGLWRLVTDELPWIMWVDGDGSLQTQLWNNNTSRVELTENVSYVRALRGWKNATIEYLDQGVIAGYIKTDGGVYYRNYARQTDGTMVWEYEKQLTEFTGTAVSLNLFITNDYRTGFIVEDNTGNISWYITHRNWSGMASPLEFIDVGITDLTFDVIPIQYYDVNNDEYIGVGVDDIWFNAATPIYPELISVENKNRSEVQLHLTFSHEIAPDIDLTDIKTAFSITDSLSTNFVINTTEAGDTRAEIIFNMNNFSSASGDMTIDYTRSGGILLDCLNEGSRFEIEDFSFDFTPNLEPPVYQTNENITITLDDISFAVTDIAYLSSFGDGLIDVGLDDIVFTVTKIDDIPL